MHTVTASEAKHGLAGIIEAAARESLVIQRQKHDVFVVLPMQEYKRLVRLSIAEFQRSWDYDRRICSEGRHDRRQHRRIISQ